jgi:GTP-binding protein
MFIDRATIVVQSGKGGDGHVSFLRLKYVPKGGPNGGNGGDGGSVYLVATPGVDTLLDFAGRHHWRAGEGQPGGIKQCAGLDGRDLEIRLPLGTLVYDDNTGELLGDLDVSGKKMLIAKGGRGGFGNDHFKSSTNQTPHEFTPGEPSEERRLRLELKLIADFGLIGMPNAGKSTLLSRISRATPKIADYPFTTLEPHLGIVELDGYRRMVAADIPGLIEGAHEGHGLGIEFLRHVERTRFLVHLLEVPLDASWGGDPVEHYTVVQGELAAYSKQLIGKPQIVVLNKVDLLISEAERVALMKRIQEATGQRAFLISGATGEGLPELLEACWELLQRVKEAESAREEAARDRDSTRNRVADEQDSHPAPVEVVSGSKQRVMR